MQKDSAKRPADAFSDPVWQDQALWRVWCWGLLRAAKKSREASLGGVPVRLAAGQLAASLEQMRQDTGLEVASLRQALSLGKRLGILEVQPVLFGLRITIVDWQYHSRGLPAPPFTPRRHT